MSTSRLLSFSMIVCVVAVSHGRADDNDKVATIDRRADKATAGDKYFVVLCARPHGLSPKKDPDAAPTDEKKKTVGHAWVVWGVEDAKKKESRYDASFGFYPVKGEKVTGFNTVPGELVDQLNKPRKDDDYLRVTHRLIVVVDKTEYEKALAVADKWKKEKPEYKLFSKSCKTFTNDVAKSLGLTSEDESKFDWPEDMMVKMIEKATKK